MSDDLTLRLAAELLILLLAANGTPVILKRLLGDRWAFPLDGGLVLPDGRRLFGKSKTLRGFFSGAAVCGLTAWLLGYEWSLGVLFGLASLVGDLISSFIKRRMTVPSSGMTLGLDQIPESLLPLWLFRQEFGIGVVSVCILAATFLVGALLLSRIMFHIGVRDRPY